MNAAGDHYPKQISTGTENQIPPIFTYKWELSIDIYEHKDGNNRHWRLLETGERDGDQEQKDFLLGLMLPTWMMGSIISQSSASRNVPM